VDTGDEGLITLSERGAKRFDPDQGRREITATIRTVLVHRDRATSIRAHKLSVPFIF
jgi:hypothetical protein